MPSKILVVDDEPHLEIVILQAFRKEIKADDLTFLFARNGEHALKVLERSPDVDMVLSDINMPEMGGLLLLKNLNERHPLLKTIIVTAYGDMTNIRTAMNHGAFDFLNKPINFNDLKITIRKTLDHVKQLKALHRERQQRYLSDKLHALSEQMTTTLNLDEVLARFLKNMKEMFECDHAEVFLKHGNDLILAATTSEASRHDPLFTKLAGEVLELVCGQREPLTLTELKTMADAKFSCPDSIDPDTLTFTPLISKHGVPGLVLITRARGKPFGKHERDAVYSLSGKAAAAIENAKLFEDVRRLAITDSLTGLYNRRHFMEQAEKEVTRSLRYGNPLCAIMIDIDRFKHFNDNYGHAGGDVVLREVAEILSRECRKTDLLGRYGGDEMIVLLIETDRELGLEIADRLRQTLAKRKFEVSDKKYIPVTVSMGMAAIGEEVNNLSALLSLADQRLYSAKQKGRNRVVAQ